VSSGNLLLALVLALVETCEGKGTIMLTTTLARIETTIEKTSHVAIDARIEVDVFLAKTE